ncbi:MAG: DNA primase noncatalytic subunit PriX [Sulfolobales archaeon]
MSTDDLLNRIKKLCNKELSGECIGYIDEFIEKMSSEIKVGRKKDQKRYEWIERVITRGLPDGRKRFILKVLTPYLVNVLSLSDEEAFNRIKDFIDNSCNNHGNCEKIYDSWVRGDIKRVRTKKLKPSRLENLDEDLREIVRKVLSETV